MNHDTGLTCSSPPENIKCKRAAVPETNMTGKELLLNAVRNQATPRAAWIPFVGVHGGKLIGATADEYLRSPDRIVEGLTRAHERYRPDGLPVVFDLQIEAEVLGCELRWAEETPPAVVSHPLTNASLSDLPTFDLAAGRFPTVFHALQLLKQSVGQDTALYGLITGPFTLATHLVGTGLFLDMVRKPDEVQRTIDHCAEVAATTADGYLQHGADVIAVVDPMTSQISPTHFDRFVTAPINRVFAHVRERGGFSSMFVCGNAAPNLENMCRTNCDNVSIDENVPLMTLRDLAHEYGRSFGGNLALTSVLLLGDADDARLEAIRCLDIGGTNGFILAPGCDLPYAVPEANLEAVAEMVHDEYQRQVAATTLRAKAAISRDDITLPDYANEPNVIVDVITLDSASCAPCQYMMKAAEEAATGFGDAVLVHERKITTHEGLAFMTRLGVENVPTICIDGTARFISTLPDSEVLRTALSTALEDKRKS
jgi:uroporphyrinogen decarboxylase